MGMVLRVGQGLFMEGDYCFITKWTLSLTQPHETSSTCEEKDITKYL